MPTPMAPPSTDSAVRSMPTADSAMIRPKNISSARVALLTALRSDRSLPTALRSRRVSMADDTHSDRISTAPAVRMPSIMVRRLSVVAPIFQVIWSSSASTTGSRPLTHSTMASQATHEMVRSSTRTQGAVANATCSTFTPTRITTSDTSTGIATLNAANGKRSSSSARAT